MISHESERLDFTKVPQSQGVVPSAYWVLVIGLLGIFFMGAFSIYEAGYNHKWPAAQSMRMDLGKMPPIK
jgi:hypothetical protein